MTSLAGGGAPKAESVRADAPGRVNLIGEHTDYNGGFVLPVALPQRTRVELRPRRDRRVRVSSAQYGAAGGNMVTYELGSEQRDNTWADYVRGVTHVLADVAVIAGFDAHIDSDVPAGAGLASSAALEVALLRALRAAFDVKLDDIAVATLARRAENEFVGAPVGIMDQMAASLASTDTALFLDTRSLEWAYVPLPASAAVIVIDSGLSHRNAGGGYGQRRAECTDAAARLGVSELRDVAIEDLERACATLPSPLDRRVRHVVTENQRVLDTVAALTRGDVRETGRLFVESHASMRDNFEVSLRQIDEMVTIAMAVEGIHGARLTGGGFGGSIVALADTALAAVAARAIVSKCRESLALAARAIVPPTSP